MTNPNKKIFLIDGSSYLYRAFHAMPPLTTSTGLPTGAVKGVTNMLRNLRNENPNSHYLAIFDAKGKNFRHSIYKDYKANRPPMPPELREQLAPLKSICNAMGMPVVEIPDVEADDVIATLAVMGAQRGIPMIISSLDKDLMQLVEDPLVKMVNTMNNKVYDVAGVQEKFGVHPDQIIDYLALVGDTSDNIPGVPKVGPKTAVKWLNEFKDLEGITQNAENFPGVVGQNLRDSIQDLDRNVELVTLKKDVDLSVSLDELLAVTENQEELNKLFASLEFKNWIKSSDGRSTDEPIASVPSKEYETVLSDKALETWAEKLNKCSAFAIDTETSSLDTLTADLIGISLSCEEGEGCYVPIQHSYEGMPEQLSLSTIVKTLGEAISNNQTKLVGQNLKFDLPILNRHGIKVTEFLGDTMLMSYVLNSTGTRHGLDRMAVHYLQYQPMKYEEVAGSASKQINFAQVEIPAATFYAAEDADITFQLHEALWPKISGDNRLLPVYQNLEVPLIRVLSQIERNGVLIDCGMLETQSEEITRELADLTVTAFELAGETFNLSSPKQLQAILFEKLQLPVLKKTPKGQPSTNESVLQELALDYPLPKVVITHRGLSKLKSTYTDQLPKLVRSQSGRLHTSYQQAVAATGRLSSTDPNLQNIPIRTEAGRRVRKAFIAAPKRCLLAADYSQIELRIMAHLSGDEGLTTAFQQGLDIHRATAAEVFGVRLDAVTQDQRRSAKAINFGLIYGMSAFGLSKQLGIPRVDAQTYMDLYFQRYPGVQRYMQDIRAQAADQGYVETWFGRRLYLPEIKSSNFQMRQAAERTAINAPMQGTAADIIKRAMIDVQDWLNTSNASASIIMQVHDELVLEVDDAALEETQAAIIRLMCGAAELSIPLEVEVGVAKDWEGAH